MKANRKLHLVPDLAPVPATKPKRSTLKDTKAQAAKKKKSTAAPPLGFDELTNILTRPVAYHRIFAVIAGSVEAGVWLSQLYYWTVIVERTNPDADGWFWKTQEQWEEETALRRAGQETSRKQCLRRNLHFEEMRPLPAPSFQPRLYYKLNKPEFLKAIWKVAAPLSAAMQQSRPPQRSRPDRRNVADKEAALSPPLMKAETTTETSPQTTTTGAVDVEAAHAVSAAPLNADIVASLLIEHGVSQATAHQLAIEYSEEAQRQVEYLGFRTKIKDPAATLISAIREAWSPPPAWTARQKKIDEARENDEARAQSVKEKAQATALAQKQAARSQAENDALDAHYKSLPVADRKQIDDQATRALGALRDVGLARQGAFNAARRNVLRKELGMPTEDTE